MVFGQAVPKFWNMWCVVRHDRAQASDHIPQMYDLLKSTVVGKKKQNLDSSYIHNYDGTLERL